MVLETVDLVLVGVLLIISLWRLYNVPILATGVKDFRESRQKPQKKSFSDKFSPTFSIVVPVGTIDKICVLVDTIDVSNINRLTTESHERNHVVVQIIVDQDFFGADVIISDEFLYQSLFYLYS
jgi:hypothetical protein